MLKYIFHTINYQDILHQNINRNVEMERLFDKHCKFDRQIAHSEKQNKRNK